MSPPALAVSELVLVRNGRVLSDPLSFNLVAGEAIHLVGVNGSGKTTLLDTLATLATAQSGCIYWQGQELSEVGDAFRALVHYCGHVDALKSEWSLLENLQWQARLMGYPFSIDPVKKVLKLMALSPLAHLPVARFSKGQQRRAALLKLKLFKRPLWLLDEPFSALDLDGASELVRWINQHLSESGAVIFTTHQGYPALSTLPTSIFLGKK